MKSKKVKPVMTFRQAVEATSDIETGYLPGLTAFGVYSKRVVVTDTTRANWGQSPLILVL